MLSFFAFVASFTTNIFRGQPSSISTSNDLHQQSANQHLLNVDVSDHREWVEPMSAAPPFDGKKIANRMDWRVTCDSALDEAHTCGKAIDGDNTTFWLTNRTSPAHPNFIIIDLNETHNINGISVEPRQDGIEDGNIAAHEVYLSTDGEEWAAPVSYGTWWSDRTEKFSGFEAVMARFVRLAIYTDAKSSPQTAIAELNVYTSPSHRNSPHAEKVGIWGPTIDTPIVPVTAFVDPFSQQLVLISSKRHDNFAQDRPDFTLTATWDWVDKTLVQARVEDTNHNMFCPGLALDADGRVIVSGGSSGRVTSIFNGSEKVNQQWMQGADLLFTRGYHAAVLNADGRMFVIGGSWGHLALKDPEERIKNAEIYDPKRNRWTLLPRCKVIPMHTADKEYYRRDNHGMLFTWKNDTVFQAGPSKELNWYSLNEMGGWAPAGLRVSSDGDADHDAMCGQAVMIDALKGQILVFGGATDYYGGGVSSKKTFLLTLGEPNATVKVEKAEPMAYGRTYAQAVVVPNGDVIVAGGQDNVPIVFDDSNPVLEAESFSPSTGHWTRLANASVVRVYHSFTLLLPDARIISGGGGLCGDLCAVNHFDMQIFTPPYLLSSNGQLATRPVIMETSTTEFKPGAIITIITDVEIEDASLIRYSGTTHTVNNDQRRVPLKVTKSGPKQAQLHIPSEAFIVIPGYWMLFVMNAQGVPSVAETVKVLIK